MERSCMTRSYNKPMNPIAKSLKDFISILRLYNSFNKINFNLV